MEAAGQALLDAPLEAANNVPPLLAKLAEPAAHAEVRAANWCMWHADSRKSHRS